MKKHILIAFSALLLVLGLNGVTLSDTLTLPVGHGRVHRLYNGASTNWSGYAAETNLQSPQSNAVSGVSGQWVVPTVTCASRSSSYSSIWVGIDGYSDSTVEQTGTDQDCSRRTPVYYAWYEMYPQASFRVSLAVAAGNVMTASVLYNGNNSYSLTINNVTTGKSFSTTQQLANAGRQSAEWIVEAPSSWFGVLPLANFGTAHLSNSVATINGHTGTISDPAWQYDPITMVTNSGTPKAVPSVLSSDGSSFSDTWHHS